MKRKRHLLLLLFGAVLMSFSALLLTSCDDDEEKGIEVEVSGFIYSGEYLGQDLIKLLIGPEFVNSPLQEGVIIQMGNNPFDRKLSVGETVRFTIEKATTLNNSNKDAAKYRCVIKPFERFTQIGEWIVGNDDIYTAEIMPYVWGPVDPSIYERQTEIEIIAILRNVSEGSLLPADCIICFDRKDLPKQKYIPLTDGGQGSFVQFRIKRYIEIKDRSDWGKDTPSKAPRYFCEVEPIK